MERYSVTDGEFHEVPPAPGRRRWFSFAGSVGVHLVMGGLLAIWPELDNEGLLRSHERNIEDQMRNAKKTLLYFPPAAIKRLPDVSPRAARRVTQQAKSIPDPQMIRTLVPRRTVNTDQLIRVPVPKIREQQPVPSPNVVVIQQTLVAPPPPPPPPAPTPAAVPVRTPPKTFVAPTASSAPPRNRTTSEGLMAAMENVPRQPNLPVPVASGTNAVPNVPTNRAFVPPPTNTAAGKGPASSRQIEVSDAGAPKLNAEPNQGSSPLATTIILSANPTPGAPPPKPEGNRNARIAVGGESGTGRRTPVPEGGLTAPGVVIRSTNPPPVTPGPAIAGPPKPPATVEAPGAARPVPVNTTTSISAPLRPGVRRVPAQVEARFQNRVVYSTVVPSVATQPDWVLWFGDPPNVYPPYERVAMRPPVPEKGTLPGTIPGLPVRTWVAGKLRKNGILVDLVFAEGGAGGTATPPAAAAALVELVKWTFQPAVRNGQPAEVDVLIEINWRP